MGQKAAESPFPREAPAASAAPATSLPVSRRKPAIMMAPAKKKAARCAQSAGETAAECTAICCCCACGLISILVDVLVKLPAGLIRRALRRRRKNRRKKARTLPPVVVAFNDDGISIYGRGPPTMAGIEAAWPERLPSAELSDLESVMTAKFHGAGFWRSPSQKEEC